MYAYKKDSRDINEAITKPLYEVPPELQDAIEGITNFIDKNPIREPIKVYRGEGHYGIFSGNKTTYDKYLSEELERIAQLIDAKILNEEQITSFVEKELLNNHIVQPRFLSTAMDISPAEEYAKTVLWDIEVPKGTKGVQIEPYNVERKAEDEFLIQRGSKLLIKNAKYDKTRKLWLLSAIIEQEK